jgi:hypothetical protein
LAKIGYILYKQRVEFNILTYYQAELDKKHFIAGTIMIVVLLAQEEEVLN